MREAEQVARESEDAELLTALAHASDGLLMRSEADYPFTIVNFGNIDEDALNAHLCALIASQSDTANVEPVSVETTTLEHFFRVAVKAADWHDAKERARTLRFQALVKLLTQSLQHTRVYRIGTREIAVFIIGQSASGAWFGLHTRVVET